MQAITLWIIESKASIYGYCELNAINDCQKCTDGGMIFTNSSTAVAAAAGHEYFTQHTHM